METDFTILSHNDKVAQVLCNCGHVQEVSHFGENDTVICELCGSSGGVI